MPFNIHHRMIAPLAAGLLLIAVCSLCLHFLEPDWRWREHLLAIGAFATLPLGAYALLLRPSEPGMAQGISRQLRSLVASDGPAEELIAPVQSPGVECLGWNRLVDTLQARAPLAIIESRLAEKAPEGAQAEQSEILNALSDGVVVTDPEGRVQFVNQSARSILDLDAAAAAQEWICDLLPDDLPDNVQKTLLMQLPITFDSEGMRADGPDAFRNVVLRWSRRPSLDQQGDVAAQVWTVRDITQQRLAEKSREDFVAMATHELRTPLTNITAYAETLMMADDIDVEEQKSFFNIITSESKRLSRFIDELLEVSRMEAGGMSINRQETDLMRLVKEVCEKVRPEMDHKQQEFVVTLPPKLPMLHVDKDTLSASLVNLLGNASKYTPENGTVAFEVTPVEKEIQFAVSDTGIGIAPEDVPKVFEKFFRSDDNRVRDITGSGLGLAITNEIARLHGGRIDLTSELNVGSTFRFVLPTGGQGGAR